MTDENVDGQNQPEPTKTIIYNPPQGGSSETLEWDSIHSVEITSTVKEGPRVSKVKVYDADPMAAARVAAALFREASSQLARILATDAAESDESDG